MSQYASGTQMNYPTNLDIVDYKIKVKQFGFAGLPNETEEIFAKQLNDRIITELNTKHHMNVNKLKKYICEFGHKFYDEMIKKIPEEVNETLDDEKKKEIYTRFVGDYFEAFAEFFLKTFDNDSRFGVKDYHPAIETEDMGVDGYGLCYNDTTGENKCVVQVKYRVDTMNEIEYSALARTFTQGVMEFGVNPNIDNCIILFSSCKGANYRAHNVLKNTLFEINDKKIDNEINNVQFWNEFVKLF